MCYVLKEKHAMYQVVLKPITNVVNTVKYYNTCTCVSNFSLS